MFAAPPPRASLRDVFRTDREVYFSLHMRNDSSEIIPCDVTNTLLYAPFADSPANSVRVAVARFQVPTMSIPYGRNPFTRFGAMGFAISGPGMEYLTFAQLLQMYTTWVPTPPPFPGELSCLGDVLWAINYLVNWWYTVVSESSGPPPPVFQLSGTSGVTTYVSDAFREDGRFFLTQDLAHMLGVPYRKQSFAAEGKTLPEPFVELVMDNFMPCPANMFVQYDQMYVSESVTQRFNPVDRFIVSSTGLAVDGNREGSNSAFPLVTDVLPNPDSFTLGDPFIYLPLFYRWYTITQGPPYERINLSVLYEDTSGATHKVMCKPGESWSILLVFRRGQAD